MADAAAVGLDISMPGLSRSTFRHGQQHIFVCWAIFECMIQLICIGINHFVGRLLQHLTVSVQLLSRANRLWLRQHSSCSIPSAAEFVDRCFGIL
jgi:hypothetical protein